MEKIVVNRNAQQCQIENEIKSCLEFIKENANKGVDTTELLIPKHIASEVREGIEIALQASNTRYNFCTVRRSPNEFTGKMQYFTSETIGNERRYKLQLFS